MKHYNSKKEFFELIHKLIRDNKTKEALDEIINLIGIKDINILNICTILSSKLSNLSVTKIMGVISIDEYLKQKSLLDLSILELLPMILELDIWNDLPKIEKSKGEILFQTHENYFKNKESYLLYENIRVYYKYLPEFDSFYRENLKRIKIIYADGGCGKSHFLRQLSEFSEKYFDEIFVLTFLNLSPDEILKELQQKLFQNDKKVLLLLDDAERKIEALSAVFNFVQLQQNIKIVLTSRTAGIDQIEELIHNIKDLTLFYAGSVNLSKWESQDLIELLRLASQQETFKHEEHIVKHIDNPYLIVELGKHKAGLSKKEIGTIRENIALNILNDCKLALKGIVETNKIQELLAYITLITPIKINDKSALYDSITTKLGIKKERIDLIIEKLVKAGILREIGLNIRFNPDTKGDFFLASYFRGKSQNEVSHLMELHLNINEVQTFRNVQASMNYLEKGRGVILAICNIIKKWIEEAAETEGYIKSRRVRAVELLIAYDEIADFAVELVNKYLEIDRIEEKEENDNNLSFYRNPSLNEYASFVLQLIYRIDKKAECLDIIEQLHQRKEESYYGNYQPTSLVKEAFKFFNNSIESYKICIDFLKKWIHSRDNHNLELAKYGMKTILAATHEKTTSQYHTISIGERAIPDDERYYEIRLQVIDLIDEMLENVELELLTIEIIDGIGKGGLRVRPDEIAKMPTFQKFNEERALLIPKMGKKLLKSDNFLVQKAIENLFFSWWLHCHNEEVISYLKDFDRSPEYLLLKYSTGARFIFEDFENLLKNAPAENRWKWFWANNKAEKRWEKGRDYYYSLVKKLAVRYDSPKKITAYLRQVKDDIEKYSSKDLGYRRTIFFIVGAWVFKKPEIFKTLKQNEVLWNQLTDNYQSTITGVLIEKQLLNLDDLGKEIIQSLPEIDGSKIDTFLRFLRNVSSEEKTKWFRQIIPKANYLTLSQVAGDLKWQYKNNEDSEIIASLLIDILERNNIENELFFSYHNAGFTYEDIIQRKEFISNEKYNRTKELTLDWVKKLSKINHENGYSVLLCLDSVQEFIDFFEYRLKNWSYQFKNENFRPFRILEPFTEYGYKLNALKNLIQNLSDFERLFNVVLEWKEKYQVGIGLGFQDLVEEICQLKNPKAKEFYFIEFIEKNLHQSDIEETLKLSYYLPQEETYFLLLIDIWKKALLTLSEIEVERAIHYWNGGVFSKVSWNGSREYSEKALFEKLIPHIPSTELKLKKLIDSEYKRILRSVEFYEKRQEEDWLR